MGCVMMRVCHLDTCPVGVATQNPVLRERFAGKAEYLENYFRFVAEEVRELLAELGFRSLDEAIGHAECIDPRAAIDHWKADGLDLSPILHVPDTDSPRRCLTSQDHGLAKALDNELIALSARRPGARRAGAGGDQGAQRQPHRRHDAGPKSPAGTAATACPTARSTSRSRARPASPSAPSCPRASRCGWRRRQRLPGQGLSGGRLVVRPDRAAPFAAEEHIIAGT